MNSIYDFFILRRKRFSSTHFVGINYLFFYCFRFLYWSDWGETPNIQRAFLDGTKRTIIVQQDLGFPNGITIDYKERRLYWTDALKDRIDTSDLNGQHRVQLIPEAKNPFGMTQVSTLSMN